ncbi:MAG: HAD-IIA family hydrolase [Lachnospiraceae bacterium]|nr:HAD-IIA family hydrolase [Lachnospiraceae bacterium]
MKSLKDVRLFVLDLDGTFYLGERLIPGAIDFIEKVKKSGREFLFFTNNSSKSPKEYLEKFKRLGCPIDRLHIMTSGDVMIGYLKENHPGRSVYLLGTPALKTSFAEGGIPLFEGSEGIPDIVVVGFDQTLTYEKLTKACTYIRNGSQFLSTHMDINCPIEGGFIPDSGAICAAITASTGAKPKYVGKPFKETVDMIERSTGFLAGEMAFVGDRIYTDVATGVKNGSMGILVLSGETKIEDIPLSEVQPDFVFDSLKGIEI